MRIGTFIVIAADDSASMVSQYPSALHPVCGRSVIDRVLSAGAGLSDLAPMVIGPQSEALKAHLGECARFAAYGPAQGIGAALREVCGSMGEGPLMIVKGNMPLIEPMALERLAMAANAGSSKLVCPEDGRVSALCMNKADLLFALERAGGALDTLDGWMEALGDAGVTVLADGLEVRPVHDRASLWECDYLANSRNIARCLGAGVTMLDPTSVRVEDGVRVGMDSVIHPNVQLTGDTAVGEGTTIGMGSVIHDTTIGKGCTLSYVVANGAIIGDHVSVGPFVNLRPGTRLCDNVKVGDFVEIKNSNVGMGSKVPHLTYMGDADVGARVNVGCGTVFVNYDGRNKHRTIVGDDVFLGCQTNLVAPIRVGDGAFTAAGSTITKDVPPGAMSFARSRQINKEGYASSYYKALDGDEE